MYKEFFGFEDEPFRLTPDPDYFYDSEIHDDAIATIEHAINSRRGIIVLTGEVGVGKTTITRVLLNNLIDVETSLVLNPFLDENEMLNFIAKDFGLNIDGLDKGKVFSQLVDFFVSLYKDGKNALIMVDEAQHLSFESMEMLRQISNIELEDAKLVQILFVGQFELVKKLNENRLRQIKQRIAYWINLKPLSYEETKNYISYRVQQALRYKKCLFKENAIRLIYKFTKGNPREINQVCELALIIAASYNKRKVDARSVIEAAREYYKFNKQKLFLAKLLGVFK